MRRCPTGYGGASGTTRLTVRPGAPTNDDLAAAQPLPTPGPTGAVGTALTHSAGVQAGEPAAVPGSRAASVWFQWVMPSTPPGGVPLPVAVSTVGSSFDTVLAVYRVGPGGLAAGFGGLSLLAANDDCTAGEFFSRGSCVAASVPGGALLVAQVDGYVGAVGTVTLSVQVG